MKIGAALFLGALTFGSPTMAVSADGEIVVLGDSLTAGYGLSRDQAYPAILQRKVDAAGLGWRVTNAGVNGNTSADGAARVGNVVTAATRVLILALGANDGLQRLPVAAMKKNLIAIIEQARRKSPSISIVLAGMRMPAELAGRDFAAAYEETFIEVAKQEGTILLPYLLDQVGGIAALNQSDTIHPTARGQRKMADTVWRVLEPLLRD